jgi:hypothetical protein
VAGGYKTLDMRNMSSKDKSYLDGFFDGRKSKENELIEKLDRFVNRFMRKHAKETKIVFTKWLSR